MNKKLRYALQVLLALPLIVFGINGLFPFLPMPDPETLPPGLANWMGALISTGYVFPVVKITEILVGISLISNKFVALALILLVPVSINIVGTHLAFDPAGVGPAAVVALLNVILLFAYKSRYEGILKA